MRQLLLFLLVYLVGTFFSRALRNPRRTSAQGGDSASGQRASRPQSGPALVVPMVQCASCGIHLPKSEAVLGGADYFCCAEHAAQASVQRRTHEAS